MIMKSPSLNYQVGWKKYGLKTPAHVKCVCTHCCTMYMHVQCRRSHIP